MKSIAAALKNAAAGFFKKFGNGLTADKCYLLICESIEAETKMIRENKSEIEVYRCSSLCRYPFNEMNFGLGKPIWVGMFNSKIKNTFILMDSLKPGGIEALVTLEKDKMAILEKD
ncbi:hypothetical protein ACH5RR_040446 [Cinchona calisaya]|uniref:Uncharacterized protein n=1 Tax=Cinchona calisaya TaxID=153742 RepID=A0ABD2XRW6_9GENT